mmetsp:Transcript_13395/g.28977  ORF Transcript_13395/g.28977 Transcript_13395/m.28977 type:complete len:96 (+) Transcript_13395:988-1275(+)
MKVLDLKDEIPVGEYNSRGGFRMVGMTSSLLRLQYVHHDYDCSSDDFHATDGPSLAPLASQSWKFFGEWVFLVLLHETHAGHYCGRENGTMGMTS